MWPKICCSHTLQPEEIFSAKKCDLWGTIKLLANIVPKEMFSQIQRCELDLMDEESCR